MHTLLVKNATLLVTMDDARRRFPDGGLYVEDNVIRQVGPTAELPPTADRVIDAAGMVVLPGLVNTHHHLYQSLTRALPAAQDAELFDWLRTLYPIWAGLSARGGVRQRPGRPERAGAVGLHHRGRPPLPLPQRQPHRRRDPRRAGAGRALSPQPGQHVAGQIERRPAARLGGPGRGRQSWPTAPAPSSCTTTRPPTRCAASSSLPARPFR